MTTLDSEEKPLFEDVENLYLTYAVCHLSSMTSAISNPVMYGFMNENFRQEFVKIWSHIKTLFSPKCIPSQTSQEGGISMRVLDTRQETFKPSLVSCRV